jgi:hypothetical protein
VVVVIGILVTGCGTTAQDDAHPVTELNRVWITDWMQNSDRPPTDFQLSVIEDFWITDAELQEARSAHTACIVRAHPDLEVSYSDDGLSVRPSDIFFAAYGEERGQQMMDDLMDSCSDEYLGLIPSLYQQQRVNPEGLSLYEGIRDCLVRVGHPEVATMGEDEFWDYVNPGSTSVDIDPTTDETTLSPWANTAATSPFDNASEHVLSCFGSDPWNHAR